MKPSANARAGGARSTGWMLVCVSLIVRGNKYACNYRHATSCCMYWSTDLSCLMCKRTAGGVPLPRESQNLTAEQPLLFAVVGVCGGCVFGRIS